MFPHARNSLRRWSPGEQHHPGAAAESSSSSSPRSSGSKRVPIPIGVSLHNVMMTTTTTTTTTTATSSSSKIRFRPRYELQLLPLLKLEVLVDKDAAAAAEQQQQQEQQQEQQQHDYTTSSNSEGGINENVDEDPSDELLPATSNCRIVYTSPELRQSVQPEWEHLDERIDLPEGWWRRGGGRLYKSMRLRITQIPNHHQQQQQQSSSSSTKGGKDDPGAVDETNNNNNNNNNNKEEEEVILFLEIPLYPSKLERLHYRYDVPESLPPNTCLVYFSDGSTRCSPALFSVLLKHQLTEPSPIEDFSRFEDDVFRTLDGVPGTPGDNANMATTDRRRQRSESISALLEPQDLNSQLIDEFDGPEEEEEESLLGGGEMAFDESEETIIQSDVRKERARLLAMITREEKQLEEEVTCLQEEREELTFMLQEANDLERHIQLVETETKVQMIEFRKDEFRKEAQHMKLLRELQTVYPITMDPRKGYLIRNLRLPVDIYTTTVPEEEIAAALGFCCHLVFMMSKYLSISLRYRLFCNSSRSAVQLDANTFLPLFTARSVEREHLERAMGLLGANVDCILVTLGIEFTPKSHVLARLKRVYDQIIAGEIPLGVH